MTHATQHLLDIVIYCCGAAFTYSWMSSNLQDNLGEQELLRGHFTDPTKLAHYEFLVLVFALVWFVTLPLMVYGRIKRWLKS